MITKWLASPDAVWNGMLYKSGYSWEDSLGRFGLSIIAKIKGNFIFPSAQTIFNLFVIALIAVLIFALFEMESVLCGIGIGVFLIYSPSLCNTLTYYYTADSYMIAYLLSVLFVFILAKGKGIIRIAISVILLSCSMSLYQAYIGTSITLCLLYILFLLLHKKESFKTALKVSGRFLAGGCGSVSLYLATYALYCLRTGISPESTRGFDSMGQISPALLFKLIFHAYQYFFDYFLNDKLYNNSWHFRGSCNAVILLLLMLTFLVIIFRNKLYKNSIQLISIICCIILIPLAFMSIVVLAPKVSVKDITGILMLPHMNYIYIFLIVLMEKRLIMYWHDCALKYFTCMACFYVAITLGMYIQVFQNCMEYELNKTYALAQRIVIELETLPQYSSGMKVVIGGRAENGNYPRNYSGFSVVKGTAVDYGFFWPSHCQNQMCWKEFLGQYIGVEYTCLGYDETVAILDSTEYGQMPIFPHIGSVAMFDDVAVVKLSYY